MISAIFDAIALWIIVAQGFFIMFYEYDVWRMNKERYKERATWREQKRKQTIKKVEATTTTPTWIVAEPKI